jgi:hypothetical protein
MPRPLPSPGEPGRRLVVRNVDPERDLDTDFDAFEQE